MSPNTSRLLAEPISPGVNAEYLSPLKKGNLSIGNINEISAINNISTNQDVSMLSNLDLVKKLKNQGVESGSLILNDFDTQSNATSYFFNEEEMQNYEEHI